MENGESHSALAMAEPRLMAVCIQANEGEEGAPNGEENRDILVFLHT
jgi:hypothetical protein